MENKNFAQYLVENLANVEITKQEEDLAKAYQNELNAKFKTRFLLRHSHNDWTKFYAIQRVINSSKRRPAKLKDLYLASKYFK